MTDWIALTRRAGFASHRLVGWIFWDPVGIANYAALGVPDGAGYYITTRGASLAGAGDAAVTAAFGSIHRAFVAASLDLCRTHTTFEAAAAARDAAVVEGLRSHVPQICDDLGALADPLWQAADSLAIEGRVFCASLLEWPRPDDPLLSAWLAVNCIREWRGDTHWAINAAEGLDGVMAGVLDGAWRHYADNWLPRSRGADDGSLGEALEALEKRGLASDGVVNAAGLRYRQELEDRLDELASSAWRALGENLTTRYLDLVEPVGEVLLARIDETAGPNWMPAARERKPTTP